MRRRFLFSGGAAFTALLAATAMAAEPHAEKKGLPQLDPASYPSQLFWLGVFFILFYLFMWLVAVPRVSRILGLRQSQISGDLGRATAAALETERLKGEVDRSMAAAREEARTLLAKAAEDIRAEAARQDAALSQELSHRIATAEASIAASLNAALGSIGGIAAALAAEMLPKVAGIEVSLEEAKSTVNRLRAMGV